MRVLYFCAHQLWPLTSGNRLRDYHLALELAKRVSVTLVEMCHPGEMSSRPPSDSQFEEIVTLRKESSYTPTNVARGIVGPAPLTVLNYFADGAASQLSQLLVRRRFDTVQVEGIHLSSYLPQIYALHKRSTILMDWHNVESELMWQYRNNVKFWPKKLVAHRTAILLERLEKILLQSCNAHTVVSECDGQNLLTRCPSARIDVIPNGVDTRLFSAPQLFNGRKGKLRILFVGSMDYHANIDGILWFVRAIWPNLAKKHPGLEFVIAGRRPSRAVLALASERIRVTGTVADVRPLYETALAVVVPLRVGSGTRLKILEAMAAGVPVISTRLGAEGINAVSGVHFLLADSPEEMVGAFDKIVTSPGLGHRLASAARDLVVKGYDWERVGEKLYNIHRDLARTSG